MDASQPNFAVISDITYIKKKRIRSAAAHSWFLRSGWKLDLSGFPCLICRLLLQRTWRIIQVGHIGKIPAFSQMLQQIVSGHEILTGVPASQVISNVPAALLLSGFTENLSALIIGVNLGGLGTLIVSMASLISYKLIAREESQIKSAYFRYFMLVNVCFLAILLVFTLTLEG